MIKNKYDILHILISFFMCFVTLAYTIGANSYEFDNTFFAVVSLLQLIATIVLWWKKHKTLVSPFLIMVLACYVCWYGQILLNGFNLAEDSYQVINSFNVEDLRNTLNFLTYGFCAFTVAGMLFTRVTKNENISSDIKSSNLKNAIFVVGLIMVLVSAYPYISERVNFLQISLNQGYEALYEGATDAGLLSNLKMFFVPGIFLIMTANMDKKGILILGYSVLLSDCIVFFIIGGRSTSIALIISMLLFHYIQIRNYKMPKTRTLILFLILLIIAIYIFSIVPKIRSLDDKSIDKVINILSQNNESNFVYDVVNEFGHNIFSTYWTMKLIPMEQSYSYGYTYFASIMAILPNVFYGGYSFSDKAALADWLMIKLNMDYGPGYSFVAETYYNFGYLGIVMMFVLGYVFSMLYSNNKYGDERILRNTFIIITVYFTLFMARDTSLMLFRKMVYMVVIPGIMIKLLNNRNKELKKHKIDK